MSGVRVIRLLEYTYTSQEAAEADQAHWGVPPNGTKDGGVRPLGLQRQLYKTSTEPPEPVVIRSAIIQQPWPVLEPQEAR